MDSYMVEPAKSGRSLCKVSKEVIEKGELRFGSLVEFGGRASYQWRKLSCITPKVASNVVAKVGGPDRVSGFDALSPKQKVQFLKAFKAAEKQSKAAKETKSSKEVMKTTKKPAEVVKTTKKTTRMS
mmetsp:Transcript_85258/g.150723  ORF Transcript_85258/g.150723 Transcript_85258/m.150723 type:complete len:127 (+) Transcript_85258:26-406(+)